MSTLQNRKAMNSLNANLKTDNKHLLNKQQELLSLIQIYIKHQKKLTLLKQQLLDEYQKAQLIASKQQTKKQLKHRQLSVQIDEMRNKMQQSDSILVNLQQEYAACLQEYQKVIAEVSNLIERNKKVQHQITQQSDKKSTYQTVTFDYERLQNILLQEQKYFKSLSQQQQKSHQQRMVELKSIKDKLIFQQQHLSQQNIQKRFKIAFIKLFQLLTTKIHKNTSYFINSFHRFQRHTELGIDKFKSCLKLANDCYVKQLRQTFHRWNQNAFSSAIKKNIVQNSFHLNLQSKRKIIALNKIVERLNSDNLSLLHLYERTKIICLTSSTFDKKGKYLAFSKWKKNAAFLSRMQFKINRMSEVLETYCVRVTFGEIKSKHSLLKRFQIASHLLQKHENITKMGWAMRKWRWEIKNNEISVMKSFIEKRESSMLISQRVRYEKRKSKAITSLQLLITKIQLKNYFSRYYQSVKASKIFSTQIQIQKLRQSCAQTRKYNKTIRNDLQQKYSQLSLNTFSSIFNQIVYRDVFQFIKSLHDQQIIKRQALMLILTKKEVKNKFLALNQLRKNVQFYQKKEMHQVLTDLNNKMENINEKSSNFRESLKKTIELLGVHSSNKINEVMHYSTGCQQKVFFNEYLKKEVSNKYKLILSEKAVRILQNYAKNQAFKTMYAYWKNQNKQRTLIERQKLFFKRQQTRTYSNVFNALLQQLNRHKNAFSKLIHVQNVMYFYRLQASFLSIKKKFHQQTLKIQQKQAQQQQKQLQNKTQNLESLKNNKRNLQQKLTKLFMNFVNFQEMSQKNKQNNFLQKQKQKYFQIYRSKVQQIKQSHQTLSFFFKFIELKNYSIFWKSCLNIFYESQQAGLKEELGKINKKKKTFDDKIHKAKTDIQRNLHQKEAIHQEKQKESHYYLTKYETNLSFYNQKFKKTEQNMYAKQVFKVWKKQSLGAHRIIGVLSKILIKKNLIEPCQRLYRHLRDFESQHKGQLISFSLLQRKGKNQIKGAFNLWRYNIKHSYTDMIKYKIDHIDQHREQIRSDVLIKREQYANQIIRNKNFNVRVKIFMAFKNYWINAKQIHNKIDPFIIKTQHRSKIDAMKCWKWLMFYKKTKRSFLSFKKQNQQKSLKKDVFESLKTYRKQIYDLGFLSQNLITQINFNFKKQALNKLINFASYEKNLLIYERKRALHCLLMNKITKQKNIKRTVMWKWQSELIPRKHYLCNILKSIELRILKSAFAKINQKKYWNQFYIKDIAEKVTTEGYSDVNSVTNILMKEGFDPDELKGYLQKKNTKDQRVIQQVIGHMKAWPNKSLMVQGFHSWKEYVKVRKDIKKSLSKVFNFSSGLGRYFDRWRKKDPVFNEILKRESRENMLERYYDLQKLMKQYRRDIDNSLQNCQELQQINDQYAKSTKMTVQIAFSNLANSVSKGMKQGFQLWRVKAKQQKIIETNVKYDQIVDGISMLDQQKRNIKQKIKQMQNQNVQLKQKCKWGQQCGQLLKKLMVEKDGLSIDLAERQHNLKILLEDNLRLKQKIKTAQSSALNLINKIRSEEGIQN